MIPRLRLRWHVRALAAVPLLLVVAAAPTAEAQHPARGTDRLEFERVERMRLHQQALRPGAISAAQLATWPGRIGLDEAQRELLDALVLQYDRRFEALDARHGRTIAVLWPASYRYDRLKREVVPIPSPQLLKLHEQHLRLIEATMSGDLALFNGLRTHLRPDQVSALRAIEIERLRTLLAPPEALREAVIDLVELTGRLDLDPREAELIPPLLLRHRENLVEALRRLVVAIRRDVETPRIAALVSLGPLWELVADRDEVADVRDHLHDLDDLERDQWLSLVRVMWGDLQSIMSPLAAERRRILLREYVQRVWPDLMEEPEEVLSVADRMRARLPDEQEDATVNAILNIERDRLIADIERRVERLLESRLSGDLPLHAVDLVLAPLEAEHHFDAWERIAAEMDWLRFRLDLRSRLMTYTAQLQLLYQSHLAEEIDEIRRFRDAQRAMQDADGYRLAMLEVRLDQIARRAADDEATGRSGDRD